jgi:hypothetical protein
MGRFSLVYGRSFGQGVDRGDPQIVQEAKCAAMEAISLTIV